MNYLLLVAYGSEEKFWQAAFYQALRHDSGKFQVLIYTDRPEKFRTLGDSVVLRQITEDQKKYWSIDGRYHYRIKSQAIVRASAEFLLSKDDRLIHLDSDIIVQTWQLNRAFRKIDERTMLMFRCEGRIHAKRRFQAYWNVVSPDSKAEMWGSAVVGLCQATAPLVAKADVWVKEWHEKIEAHTVEQFALCETARQEGIRIISACWPYTHFSTSRRTHFAVRALSEGFSGSESSWLTSARKIKPVDNPLVRAVRYLLSGK